MNEAIISSNFKKVRGCGGDVVQEEDHRVADTICSGCHATRSAVTMDTDDIQH
jgi:hypothetical protein